MSCSDCEPYDFGADLMKHRLLDVTPLGFQWTRLAVDEGVPPPLDLPEKGLERILVWIEGAFATGNQGRHAADTMLQGFTGTEELLRGLCIRAWARQDVGSREPGNERFE